MSGIAIQSPDIASITLHKRVPLIWHLYGIPCLSLYPLYLYTYFAKYDEWVKSEEWTFIYTLGLFGGHALSFLVTRWSIKAKALITCRSASSLKEAEVVRVIPIAHKGEGELVPLKRVTRTGSPDEISFTYQADKYIYTLPDEKASITGVLVSPLISEPTFRRLPYPPDSAPVLQQFQGSTGLTTDAQVQQALDTYGNNTFNIPVPTFIGLFAEHAVAPFFVFQVFCVGLWLLDEYWFYSLFTLFMLVVFECTVVFQRLRTLNEFRSMSIKPFQVWTYRASKWVEVSTSDLLPGDFVSVVRSKEDSATPCDLLLLSGSAIVNEAMLSGESTPLLKESIELRDGSDKLDINGADRNNVVFGGTKVLQTNAPDAAAGSKYASLAAPDGGALGVVLRTGFGTTQGQLIRLMVFTNEGRVSANNIESFVFIAFLLVFAIAASAYVWIKGNEMGRPKGKLLLDCVLIITSVVPPELPMELSMAVNTALMALAKVAIFCTEPFRIPYAGRVDVCCFDKTGTITGEDLVVQGIAQVGTKSPEHLHAVKDSDKDTTLTLAAAHALVLLEDGVVGDPMEKTTLEALDWKLNKGDVLNPSVIKNSPHKYQVQIRRRFQFSSALKRMSTVSFVSDPSGNQRRMLVAVKGAPETLKGMYSNLPAGYDETYKSFTRRGSRVLALGYKYLDGVTPNADTINNLTRESVEAGLQFAGFLIFHCPLKPDAVASLKQLHDSSHRCIMITGDNPLTAVHVASEVEIVDRETLILDVREGATSETDLVWRSVDEKISIPVNPEAPIDTSLFDKYDICMTGVALKQYQERPEAWKDLIENTWVYARVSPSQKEFILESFRKLGYITLMAGDGTNDVGALKAANVGIALLDGTPEDLVKIAEHQKNERMKKVYESQLSLTSRFGQPPPPVPPQLKALYPDLEKARDAALANLQSERRNNPSAKFDFSSITSQMADLDEDGPPQIRLGDASVAAPFTSKLGHVNAIVNIIRQGRCTLVAFTQMHKILALNCLIQAYSLSVLYLDGIKYGDYQVTINGMLMSVCFLCISRAKPMEKLSAQRPLARVLSAYVFISVLLQFALHVATTHYLTLLVPEYESPESIDLEAKFNPSLLNSAIFLIGLSQQVNTFSVNYIGHPHRESLRQNQYLYYGLLSCFGVAFAGATEFMPEMNEWLQLVKLPGAFQVRLVTLMVVDFVGCYIIEWTIKAIFADQQPKDLITKRRERMYERRKAELEKVA
ncbi:putative SPF1-P-type ATPase [Tilletiaria anomala UBC 951]|uniref:Putative SPF1-P-type ATPase n=1 Tax=Tilletiaria anomala (strain ATCC 24038 / CBS 436.72 / UBC 951) TaxID=1037660 RepID=A0A066VTR8_TILAU|nr:putative SPF1-P-type ATPase [Tilletiaria anomala UBC 951]KDN43683.1 putative SPF1-P-type ATPase [Tilletiaria anomala UBC 951]